MDKMALNQQWNINPPEPLPMNKAMRETMGNFGNLGLGGGGGGGGVGNGGGGGGGMPRQITKNPLNMLGGMSSDRSGGYSNGGAQQNQGGFRGGFMENRGDGMFGASRGGFNDSAGLGGFGKIGDGMSMGGSKMGMNSNNGSSNVWRGRRWRRWNCINIKQHGLQWKLWPSYSFSRRIVNV